MSYLEQELARLESALDARADHYAEIYAARQAIAWAMDPGSTRSPSAYLTGIPAG